MKKFIILAIMAIVLVSGCTSQSFFSGYSAETQAESPDILSITNPSIIPDKVFSEDSFDINFKIKNSHETRDIDHVGVSIQNWNPCEITAINGNPIVDDQSTYQGLEEGTTKLTAGSELPIGLTLTAKTASENLAGQCKIIYTLNYKLEAITTFNGISVMDSDTYRTLLKSGEEPAEKPIQHIGTGPIRIEFETEQKFPIESNPNKKITMFMRIKNIGSGLLGETTKGDIPIGSVQLKIPTDLVMDTGEYATEPCDRFEIISDGEMVESQELKLLSTGKEQIIKTNKDTYTLSLTIDEEARKFLLTVTDSTGEPEIKTIHDTEVKTYRGLTITIIDSAVNNEYVDVKVEVNGEDEFIVLSDEIILKNKDKIPIIDGESLKLKCVLNGDITVPYEKTYYIQANYLYEYELREEIKIDVDIQWKDYYL